MRIGLDTTAMPAQRVGAGNYIFNLAASLAELVPADDLFAFARRGDCPPIPNVRLLARPLNSRLGRILWEQFVLPSQLSRLSIDVLHSPHYTMPLAAPSTPIVTFHDMTFYMYPEMHQVYRRLFFKTMIRLSIQRARAIIADSESSRHDILRLLPVDSHKVFTVPLGVGQDFRPISDANLVEGVRSKYHLPAEFILYVGVLEPRKNLPTLVRAFKTVVDHGLPHYLVIVGPTGWKYDQIFKTITSLELNERVLFTGYVPEEELPLLYNAAQLFAYPSFYEGFGLPVLEALACGVPVVTSNISSMPEIVGDSGILIDPRDVNALSEAMLKVLQDDHLRHDLSQKGMERATLFPWRYTAQKTLDVYRWAFDSARSRTSEPTVSTARSPSVLLNNSPLRVPATEPSVSPASVSAIIPCFNAEKTIRRALESIKQQTLGALEVICIDDGSTDHTAQLIEEYRVSHPELPVRLLRTLKNSGPSTARNLGWEAASGDYVAFLDADDTWHPEKIAIQYSWMLEHPQVVLCGHAHSLRLPTDQSVPPPIDGHTGAFLITRTNILLSNPFATPSAMLKRSLGYRFDAERRYTEDYLLWMQICLDRQPVAMLTAPLASVFQGQGERKLSQNIIRMRQGDIANYWQLWRKKKISALEMSFLIPFSVMKYLLLITFPALHSAVKRRLYPFRVTEAS